MYGNAGIVFISTSKGKNIRERIIYTFMNT
jgi:hypothetical protein